MSKPSRASADKLHSAKSPQDWVPVFGFLVGNAFKEMLAGIKEDRRSGVRLVGWTSEVDLALVFRCPRQAERVARALDSPGLVVVPLFDAGEQWMVGWG